MYKVMAKKRPQCTERHWVLHSEGQLICSPSVLLCYDVKGQKNGAQVIANASKAHAEWLDVH